MILMLFIATALAGSDPCLRDSDDMVAASLEIATTYQADMADQPSRSLGGDEAAAAAKRDKKRLNTVHKYDAKGHVCSADDKFHAAGVLLRSRDSDDHERAYELAEAAMMLHQRGAPFLTAFAFDRWHVSRGLKQRYGTQFRATADGRCLIEVEPGLDDSQRTQFGAPTLTDVYRELLDEHGHRDVPATEAELRRRQLLCAPEVWK